MQDRVHFKWNAVKVLVVFQDWATNSCYMSGFLVNGYQSGLVSRSSAEWVSIQKNTFTNWVNEQLRMRGISVHDLRTDLADGVSLVALLEVLQRRRLVGAVEHPSNPHEVLQNLNVALEAVGEDNVRIVNIGKHNVFVCLFHSSPLLVKDCIIGICTAPTPFELGEGLSPHKA